MTAPAPAGGPASEPGGGDALAALWLACYERAAAAAAHEVNNALNGVAMNLEVVRLRARAGADAGLAAPFAASAAEAHDATVALVGALVALGRAPRPSGAADVGEVLAHAAALYAPHLERRGVVVRAEAPGAAAPTAAPARAVRLAVCAALEGAVGREGADGGADPGGVLSFTVQLDGGPTLSVAPAPARWDPAVAAALAAAGVRARWGPDALRVAFPPV